MTPIKNIASDVASSERVRQQERVSTSRSDKAKKQAPATESAKVESRKDTVDISSAARQLAETRTSETARYQAILATFKGGNGQKARNVQARIAQGEFDKPEVLESVADAISNLPQFRSLATGALASADSRGVLGAIAQRIRSGQYNSDEVLDRVAMNILRDIGAA